MTIHSMTGFGRGSAKNESFELTVEIKSVNNRYRDFRFRLPSLVSSMEMDFRNQISQIFKRGSFDISLNYNKSQDSRSFDDIDFEKVNELIELTKEKLEGGVAPMRPTDLLRQEFMKDDREAKESHLKELGILALKSACEELQKSRASEGNKLRSVLKKHVEEFTTHFESVKKLSGTFQDAVTDRLKKRFEEYGKDLKVEEPRLMQEILFYLEKMDVGEEVNRLDAHLSKMEKLLNAGGECGRQIDFLVQEMNRETNTIGSKSTVGEISELVVQMKVQIEKIREQGLNIE